MAWNGGRCPTYESARKRRMQPRIYRAKTMRDALARVRRDLGGDAVILAAREVRRRRLFGLGARSMVEVTATDRLPTSATAEGRSIPGGPIPGTSVPPGPSPALRVQFGEELSRLHTMVEMLSRQGRIDHLLPD